jgi:phosphoglycerate dehydrogenase-like enzyme
MKAFIFDPLWDDLITNELEEKLSSNGVEILIIKEIKPLSECLDLFEGDEERILCINPDYVSWKLSPEDYKDIPNLKAIFGAATSFSWIDMSYAEQNDIPVCNIRNFSTQAVAEWATTMMLNVARQVPRIIKDGFPLDFDKDFMKYRGVELHGKTAGIIGLGHNGAAIAQRCVGLGMNVIYWSRSSTNDEYKKVELSELFKTSDVIFPTFAKSEEANALINDTRLETVKPSAIIVDIIELDDNKSKIFEMVKTGKLFGYAFEAKPSTFEKYEGNIWAAPAYAWVTDGSMHNVMVKWTDNMVDAARGKFPNRVN